ncbi:solute carrier family 22 member 5 [Lingula anatina]|uniref:Solute carrier family 22 member 5 n=1 Tax=Lingula anatina TaxID=7574 RepID=A0A1S3JNP0_LINAN|nr:solute carrier family 22 member 5 [Lingula anatina]|eukprot:XP_013411584.1 solute carrier family 22 member 5 [Lingula anatina]
MNFDEFLKILGEFGSYQKRRYALICIMACYSVLSTLGIVFYGAEPEHHCKLPTSQVEHVTKLYGNVTRDELLELFVPYTKEGKRSGCALYRFNLGSMNSTVIALLKNSSLGGDTVDEIASTMNYTLDNDPDIIWNLTLGERTDAHPCPGQREYSKDIYKSTVVSEFDLTCENAWQLSTCNSVFFGGKLVALLVAGVMSDRFGRRPVFLVSVILLAASGISLAFAPNMAVFSVLYVIQGASDASMYMTLYTMGMEFVGPSKRKITGLFMTVCFGLGHSLLAIEAYLLPNWRHLALVASSPGVICIFFWFFLSESVRWLLARGRHEEAKKIVNKVAVVNKVKLEEATLERLFTEGDEEKKTSTHTPIDLLRTWNRAKLTIIIIICWLINDLCYYGLALHAQGLGGSIYLNFALLGAADIPGHIVGMFILDKVGRRKILLVTLLPGGVACIVSGLLTKANTYSG